MKRIVLALFSCAALITALTGWRPAVPFRDGLARTVAWIRANLDQFDPEHYTR